MTLKTIKKDEEGFPFWFTEEYCVRHQNSWTCLFCKKVTPIEIVIPNPDQAGNKWFCSEEWLNCYILSGKILYA